jgi:membrane dipeptidase
VLHVSVDADVWNGPEAQAQSMHRYTGWTAPALQAIERVREIIESEPNRLCLALTAADISQAHGQGKSAIVLGFEGGKPVEQSLDLLRTFHRLGVRVLQLTWAGGNDICDRRDPPKSEGLTPFGVELVKEMNRLGMLIDPGHCSRKTFFDVIERSTRPVAVLHTAPATKGKGDLDDEQVRAIARKGGVIGLHFFSHYLNPSRKATVEDLVEHVDYIRKLVGIDYVALGGDYLELTESFIKGHGPAAGGYLGIPEELDSYEKVVNVTRALRLHGYADEEIRKVLGGNLMRVFQQVFTPDEGLEP